MNDHLRTLFTRRWLRFSLRGMFIVITLICVWLGLWLNTQLNWIRQRQEARRWIEQHEIGDWSKVDPKDVMTSGGPAKLVEPPWSLRLLGESRLVYIQLDKSKLSEADISRLHSLQALFPEADGIHIDEPGSCRRWPPPDPQAYMKYPTRMVGGKAGNEPLDARQ